MISGDMQRHVRNVHLKAAKLACAHCKRKYSSESTLIRHMHTQHRDVLLQTTSLVDYKDTNETMHKNCIDSESIVK